jgi:hypothetical protein
LRQQSNDAATDQLRRKSQRLQERRGRLPDLDANFSYATLEVSAASPQGDAQPFSVDEFTGPGGHTQRRLIFQPAAPSKDAVFAVVGGALAWLQVPDSGTHVLGAVDGALAWIATEEC